MELGQGFGLNATKKVLNILTNWGPYQNFVLRQTARKGSFALSQITSFEYALHYIRYQKLVKVKFW